MSRDGSGFVLDGRKLWITNAGEAGLFLVFANADPPQGYRGITAFVVERTDEGFHVGKRESKLGIRASSTCELILDRCRLGADRVLGEVGRGYKYAIEILNEGRIGIGAQMLGVARAALDAAVRYSREREQFGKTIASFQAVRDQLVRLRTTGLSVQTRDECIATRKSLEDAIGLEELYRIEEETVERARG